MLILCPDGVAMMAALDGFAHQSDVAQDVEQFVAGRLVVKLERLVVM